MGLVEKCLEAKRVLSLEDFKQTMKDIYSTSVNFSTIDESPMAYKNTEDIINLLRDTCDIIEFVKPIISIKASSGV